VPERPIAGNNAAHARKAFALGSVPRLAPAGILNGAFRARSLRHSGAFFPPIQHVAPAIAAAQNAGIQAGVHIG
jgi:hypothetical protein